MTLNTSEFFNGIFSANSGYVDEVFARYQSNPESVSAEWRAYFEGFREGFGTAAKIAEHAPGLNEVLGTLGNRGGTTTTKTSSPAPEQFQSQTTDLSFQLKAAALVDAYRKFGFLQAHTNPLPVPVVKHASVSLSAVGLSESDLQNKTFAGTLVGLQAGISLAELVAALEQRFCGSVGAEIEHVANPEERTWLRDRFARIYEAVPAQTRKSIYTELAKADALEKTIHTKFIGKKRFSIEGADAQIPAIETVIDVCAAAGAQEFSLAMAHRGRLNVLIHVAGKPLPDLFAEFDGYPSENLAGDGDVKYHGGFECVRNSRSGTSVRVALSCNPSHLEFVGSVASGETRARQVNYHKGDLNSVVPIVLHGDAAFAGQGTVYETIQMMSLQGYAVGGTIHIVANNQVGFTTNPKDARSSTSCTDVAKVVDAPVFHVNADDLDALHNVMTLAAQYRNQFHKDVVVDLVCFRRHGHNETDEPRFTQPLLYKMIEEKPAPYEHYAKVLGAANALAQELAEIYTSERARMNAVFDEVRASHHAIQAMPRMRDLEALRKHVSAPEMLTALPPELSKVSAGKLRELGATLANVPSNFTVNSKLARIILGERKDMVEEKKRIDWGMGELLAYATLLNQGFSIRLAGQDARRGTFSHRHGTLVDAETGARYTSLENCAQNGAKIEIIDSLLSETAAMGFEYGYAVQHAKALVLWEGQFGDFSNGAQVIIDQFLAAGESKWSQTQGLVLLLPHGYEGQGPEHSSARMERFLQLAAQGNMQVCAFSNVRSLFHALRRQVLRDYRKPLVIFTPKSFLRNPRASTSFEELERSGFEELLDDTRESLVPAKVKRVVFCSGKFCIDLLDASEKEEYKQAASNTAVVRLEQIYPFAANKVLALLKKYSNAKSVVWAQEEPRNMGAASFVFPKFAELVNQAGLKAPLQYVGRCERASPAVGLEKVHIAEQEKLVSAAFLRDEAFEV